MQQNSTLKLATQFKINSKHSIRRWYQVFKMLSTSFYTRSSLISEKYEVYSGCWETT